MEAVWSYCKDLCECSEYIIIDM